eukprot:scaffold41889_cov189-Skeletonema_dohrnii-CCMP3373.AAC.1
MSSVLYHATKLGAAMDAIMQQCIKRVKATAPDPAFFINAWKGLQILISLVGSCVLGQLGGHLSYSLAHQSGYNL